MADKDNENFREIYDRLRETEAQTREQNARLADLCDRIASFSTVTDKFFELEDKRHAKDDERFEQLIEHEKRLSDAADKRYSELLELQKKREENFWKIATLLIGAIIGIALGPKAVTEVYQACRSNGGGKISCYMSPIMPSDNNDLDIFFNRLEPIKAV